MPKFLVDLLERVGWTAAEAGLAVVTTDSLNVPIAWAPLVAAGLALLKGFVAKHIGNGDSASTAPSV